MPRGLVMPPDIPKEAQDWWIAAMKKVVETPEWKEYIDKQLLTENVLYGEDFRAFLQRTQGTFGDILKKSGAIK
jgi:putative tricarboxylic transport membrane protein